MIALYSYWRSSASWRVRIALNVKGIEYEYRPIHLVEEGGRQHSPEYMALNPAALLPTLLIDGHHLAESLAIVRYLEQTRPSPPLVPSDAYLAARAWQIAEVVNSDIQPLQNLRILQALGSEFGATPETTKQWGKHWIERGFDAIELFLREIDGVYCVGDNVTVADICLVPQVYNAHRFGVDMSRYPHIMAAEATLSALPEFEAARPENQPDAVA